MVHLDGRGSQDLEHFVRVLSQRDEALKQRKQLRRSHMTVVVMVVIVATMLIGSTFILLKHLLSEAEKGYTPEQINQMRGLIELTEYK
ncbi:MAG TPA: hypothetical protein VD928_01375 [Candidatus Paceibacterota bacterium]|nr:hypothetical protein [Candidatus Paceibacterota bacterium]